MVKEVLKPFDLERAKAGAKLKTTSGLDVRIICYDRKTDNNIKLVALVTDNNDVETSIGYTEQGYNVTDGRLDIKIVEEVEEHERWRDRNEVVTECFVNNEGSIITSKNTFDYIIAPTNKKEALSERAFDKICHIMLHDVRFGGVITNEEWNDETILKYVIFRKNSSIDTCYTKHVYGFLSFHTKEQRDLFLNENEDLVKQYFML